MDLTAQVSLYPLREPELGPVVDRALEIFRGHGLEVTQGPRSIVISGNGADIFKALQVAFEGTAKDAGLVMVTTFSDARAVDKPRIAGDLPIRAIGFVQNEFAEPIDSDTLKESLSRIVVDADLADGLTGLTAGDRALVVFYFHLSQGYELLQHPRGDRSRPKRGVFALRSPHRPSPIGITEVEVLELEDNVLTVRGLDAIDGTPVIDLKPA
jgi:tRNA-Thr(GGU) m(6)t(6)A37 methyltransferase TsaA